MKNKIKQITINDIKSGFLVSLLALPLSLGIAKAGDFPPIFGIVTSIIGGLFASFLSGSELSVKGPAAGLIVICSGAVASFGGGNEGWQMALTAIFFAGVLQVFFGIFKMGKIVDFFPYPVIHGMLAAIGIIIMSKQIHFLLGINPEHLKGKESLELLMMIPDSLMHENAHLAEIGITCLLILIAFSVLKFKALALIPAPIIVLLVSIPMAVVLHIKTEGAIHNFALVKLGNVSDMFSSGIFKINFHQAFNNPVALIEFSLLFALIGSIESLLTVKAIDVIDTEKKTPLPNRDLVSVGLSNMLTSLFGGTPLISEVARSTANVKYGAKSIWSNFFHGLFLLIYLLCAIPVIELIPNAALAAMLVYVGFNLAHPREFIHLYKEGLIPFSVFVFTIIITLSTDLLIGVVTGIGFKLIIYLLKGHKIKEIFKLNYEQDTTDSNKVLIKINSPVLFTNYSKISSIYKTHEGKEIIIENKEEVYFDYSSKKKHEDDKNGSSEALKNKIK
jgi:MFS superfamily sulfate permease-like transporter